MVLNKTTEYSLTILSFMATRDESIYTAEYLHNELKIPRRYLRRILTDLSDLGFLSSRKGRNGGFIIARDPDKISIADIIDKVEGIEILNRCIFGFSCCILDKPCVMHARWEEVRSKMRETLERTTLGELREKYVHNANTYPIDI